MLYRILICSNFFRGNDVCTSCFLHSWYTLCFPSISCLPTAWTPEATQSRESDVIADAELIRVSFDIERPAASLRLALHPSPSRLRQLQPETMLRVGVFASTRPFLRPAVNQVHAGSHFPSSFRTLSTRTSRSSILYALKKRPSGSSVFSSSKPFARGVMNDAVVVRPTKEETWKKYAITAVCYLLIICVPE